MRNVIKDTLWAVMEKNGFRKKSDTWYRRTDDTILVVNLQKSNYGDQYYINLAVWVNALGENTFPKEYHCHIRLRTDDLDDPDRQQYWERIVFDLECTDISDTERTQQIQSLMEDKAIPFLLLCGSLEGIRKLYREGRFNDTFILVVLEKFLGDVQ